MEEEICGTIECSGGWACGQHLQPQILSVMMASELKDHFGWVGVTGKSHVNVCTQSFCVFLTVCSTSRPGPHALQKEEEACNIRSSATTSYFLLDPLELEFVDPFAYMLTIKHRTLSYSSCK